MLYYILVITKVGQRSWCFSWFYLVYYSGTHKRYTESQCRGYPNGEGYGAGIIGCNRIHVCSRIVVCCTVSHDHQITKTILNRSVCAFLKSKEEILPRPSLASTGPSTVWAVAHRCATFLCSLNVDSLVGPSTVWAMCWCWCWPWCRQRWHFS